MTTCAKCGTAHDGTSCPKCGNSTEPTRWQIACLLIWVLMAVASFFSALRPSAPIAASAILAVALLSARQHWLAQGIAGFLRPVAVGTVSFVAVAFVLDNFVRRGAEVPEAVESFVITAGTWMELLADMHLGVWFMVLAVLLVIGIGLKKWQFAIGAIALLKFLGSVYTALIAFASFSFFAAPPTKAWAEGMTREVVHYAHELRLCFNKWEERAKKAELLGQALERQRDELREFKSDVDWIAALNQGRARASNEWLNQVFGSNPPRGPKGPPPPPALSGRPRFLRPSILNPAARGIAGEPIPTARQLRSARVSIPVTLERITVAKAQATAKVQLLSTTLANIVAELPAGNMLGKQLVASVVEEALAKVPLQEYAANGEARVKAVVREIRRRAAAVREEFRAAFTEGTTPRPPSPISNTDFIPATPEDVVIRNKLDRRLPLTAAEKARVRARCPICGKANCPLAAPWAF